MCEKKILFLVGSNNKDSFTNMITKKILYKINTNNPNFQTKIICLKDLNINYCKGCLTCAKSGYCPIDKVDNFMIIRKELMESDIVFFASPVYFHSVPGIMKSFIDRITTSAHTMNFAGKKSFTLITTMSNGQYDVSKYLHKVQTAIGFKNLNNYIFSRVDDSIDSFIEKCSIDCIDKITNDYGYSNSTLEEKFLLWKNNYTKFEKENIEVLGNKYEVEYWNQEWIKECRSFQEYAVKNRKVK